MIESFWKHPPFVSAFVIHLPSRKVVTIVTQTRSVCIHLNTWNHVFHFAIRLWQYKYGMRTLNADIDVETFCRDLDTAAQRVLFLDYDGTLAPFRAKPAKAFPYPGVRQILNTIMNREDTRLVIVTGRAINDLLPLLELNKTPEIWGVHGLEHLKRDGAYEVAPMDEKSLTGLVRADEWIAEKGLDGLSEAKPGSVAIHWRGLDNGLSNKIKMVVEPEWSLIAETWELRYAEFDGGLELRVPARDKGDAVKSILAESDEGAVSAYLGDDLTDEDAFRAIRGSGLGVLVRRELRPTAAGIWITPPEELVHFLSYWM